MCSTPETSDDITLATLAINSTNNLQMNSLKYDN